MPIRVQLEDYDLPVMKSHPTGLSVGKSSDQPMTILFSAAVDRRRHRRPSDRRYAAHGPSVDRHPDADGHRHRWLMPPSNRFTAGWNATPRSSMQARSLPGRS
jgi:hypothetical protein